jgi:MFS family permease
MLNLPDRHAEHLSGEMISTFSIAALGGMLEFYDFVIFVFFTAVLGRVFFPPEVPDWLKQAEVFGLFAAGYLARPFGGLLMAHFGDLTGRKRVFMLAVLLMAVPTFVIGLLPGYARIGYAAPCLLLVCRILQGSAIGGEIPGAWVFVAEHAPRARVGLACGLLTAGLTGGILLGSLVNAAVNLTFSSKAIVDYGWRLPFLLGGVLGLVGMLLRRKLAETPVFEAMRRDAQLADKLPLAQVVRDHARAVLVSMLATWLLTAVIVVLILLAPPLLREGPGLDATRVAVAGLVSTALLTVSCIVSGAAIDRFGLKPIVWLAAFVMTAAAYLMFACAALPGLLIPVFAVVGTAAGLITIVPVTLVRAFPAAVAFSGVALAYNAAYAIAGGMTPPLVAYLFHLSPIAAAHYVAAVSVIGAAAILLWLRSKPRHESSGPLGEQTPHRA